MTQQRHVGTLRPHPAGPELGMEVIEDISSDHPWAEIAFASATDLQRAGVKPVSGTRVTYCLKRVGSGRSARAIDIMETS